MSAPVALVTGASRGFGFAVAQALAARGYHVIALARTVGGLEELDDAIQAAGGSSTLVPLDITDSEGLKRLCLSIFERWGKLDVLVHAAIFAGPLSPSEHVPPSDWEKTVNVNIRATQHLIAMTDPLLRAADQSTAVLPVDDIIGRKFFAAYGAAKAAQSALWASWAAENASRGPQIRTFAPKGMPTALRGRFFPGEDRNNLSTPAAQAQALMDIL